MVYHCQKGLGSQDEKGERNNRTLISSGSDPHYRHDHNAPAMGVHWSTGFEGRSSPWLISIAAHLNETAIVPSCLSKVSMLVKSSFASFSRYGCWIIPPCFATSTIASSIATTAEPTSAMKMSQPSPVVAIAFSFCRKWPRPAKHVSERRKITCVDSCTTSSVCETAGNGNNIDVQCIVYCLQFSIVVLFCAWEEKIW